VSEPDRFAVVEAMIKAATDLGWRPSLAESSAWRVSIIVLPPLARSRPERNRWPHEPEEGPEEHGA
jgi:hypothetical protein